MIFIAEVPRYVNSSEKTPKLMEIGSPGSSETKKRGLATITMVWNMDIAGDLDKNGAGDWERRRRMKITKMKMTSRTKKTPSIRLDVSKGGGQLKALATSPLRRALYLDPLLYQYAYRSAQRKEALENG